MVLMVLAALTAAAFAGCVGGDDDPETEEESGQNAGQGESTIHGTILTVDLEPVDGATVSLVQGSDLYADARTNAEGEYEVEGVEAGEYRIQVTAACCREHVQGVSIPEGENVRVSVQLERFTERDLQTPHMKQFEWEGVLSCSFGVLGGVSYNCGGFSSNNDRAHDFEVSEGLKTIVVAMAWDSANTNLNDGMIVDLMRGNDRLGEGIGESPIEYRVDADGEGGNDFENIEDTWDLEWLVWAGGTANVIYEQTFTVYWHEYYWEHAPEGASALPDL